MASSGTYTFNPTNGEMVLSAFARIQVRAPSIRQEHMFNARQEMNYLLVELGNLQPNLWEIQQNSINLASGTATYTVPTNTVMILDAWLTQNSGTTQQTDRYISPISRSEWASLANKNTPGQPSQYWFDRLIAPTITTYPVTDQSGLILNYFSCVRMQDANLAGGETMDIQYLWIDAVVSGLAYRLSRIYAPQLEQIREKDYDKAWKIAAAQNTENVGLSLSPAIRTYYRR